MPPIAPRDQNRIAVMMAVSSVDGATPVVLWADPVTHRLLVDVPAGSVSASSVTTFTNKTLSDATNLLIRATRVTSSATPTPTGDSCINHYTVSALATNATFAVPSGTPTEGNRLTIRVTPDATPRTLAFNAIYRAVGITLPTTTVASKTMYFGAIYNDTSSTWDIIAYSIQA